MNDLYVTKEDRYLGERNMLSLWRERNKKETNTPVLLVRARQLYLCPLVLLSEVHYWTGRNVGLT